MKTLVALGFLFFDVIVCMDIVLTAILIGLLGVKLWEKILNGFKKHGEEESYEVEESEE